MAHICLIIFAHLQNFHFTYKFLAELKFLKLHPLVFLVSESCFMGDGKFGFSLALGSPYVLFKHEEYFS